MEKVMVLGRNDLRRSARNEKWVSLGAFQPRSTAAHSDYDFVLFVDGKDIHVLKSRWGRRGLCATVKWVESQARWISLVKTA